MKNSLRSWVRLHKLLAMLVGWLIVILFGVMLLLFPMLLYVLGATIVIGSISLSVFVVVEIIAEG